MGSKVKQPQKPKAPKPGKGNAHGKANQNKGSMRMTAAQKRAYLKGL